jgi:hypothetical protein
VQNSAVSAESQTALTQLTQVLEKSIEGSLNAVADSFDSLLGRVLAAEQKRTDFQPSEMESMGHMDAPTPACGAVAALLRSLQSFVEETLPTGASGSFFLEVRVIVTSWGPSGPQEVCCFAFCWRSWRSCPYLREAGSLPVHQTPLVMCYNGALIG